ncbi:hypothetical protein GCM10007108_07700 [Thermogymnomonas acidicola]|uniref:50S ribosomal protein L24 n=1 Tax=Thermogymnomonas acidicola TaxID=399579 RepID=A0AA37BQY4_9ARCH|nr:50S ribosomal protein L24 [Thermogymnomonas acidicola]GGM72045.1 hypothetical protein GCM10007108_07700 [Thermogymnomonas acidicola]
MIKRLNVHLSRDLQKKFGIRTFPIVSGDVVRIVKGSRKGEGGKVVEVDHVAGRVSVEGITIAKADGKQKPFFLRPEELVITRLDLSRQERQDRLRQLAALRNVTVSEEVIKEEQQAAVAEEKKEVSEQPAQAVEGTTTDEAGSVAASGSEDEVKEAEGNDNEN